MKKSSMRRNFLTVIGLYAVSLVVASGCPTAKESATSDSQPSTNPVPAAISAARSEVPEKIISQAAVVAQEERRPAKPSSDSHEHAKATKFDPIAVNGKYFVGWPKPKLAIVISGRQDGYLEPCGCAGLENQKGGMGRRFTFIEQLKENDWPVVAVDVGNLVRRFGKQAEIQFAISAEALKAMGYRAVGFGPDDLRLSTGEVAAAVAGSEPGKSLFVSANASVFGLTPQVQVFEKNGVKVGVTAIIGDKYREQVNNAEIEFTPAAEALAAVVGEIADCDVRILLAQSTRDEAIDLAERYPDFNFVVTAEGGDEPPYEPEAIPNSKARLIEVGHKGMYCIVLGIYDDTKTPVRYQRVALDSRFSTAAEMQQLMAAYQDQLHDLGWEGLGLKAVAHPRTKGAVEGSGQFVGGESCKDCHTKAWEVWQNSPHAHATESLVKADPPRQFDAECISCHATGWNPQEYFPYATGFESLKRTPHLAGNSCENCHGPGGAHVAAEAASDEALRDEQRRLIKLTYDEAKNGMCQKCHDLDNSPEFNFEEYWPQIEHVGKD